MPRDYYEILGVPRTATVDELKKAYRKKAHELHPDKKGGNEAKFQEVNEAYQSLSDNQKRATYDQFGHAGARSSGGRGAGFSGNPFSGGTTGTQFDFGNMGDFSDVFSTFFGGGRPGRATGRGGQSRSGKQRGGDVEMAITITLPEAAAGVNRTIEVNTLVACEPCHGTGARPDTSRSTCATCKGSGAVDQRQETFFGVFQSSSLCPTCGGEGTVVGTPCTECSGQGRRRQRRSVQVSIPPGIADGQTLRMNGQGEAGAKGGPPGDTYITIRVQPHPKLRRDGNDLLLNINISMKQAALGGTVIVPTINGQADLKIPSGIQNNTILKMSGKGMPHLQRWSRGDELVTVHVQTPTKLNKEQKKALEEWF